MQKIINAVAIISGTISLTLVGSGIFLYVNRDSLIDSAKEKIMINYLGCVKLDR